MELDAPRFGTVDAESLVRGELAACEPPGAGRRVEDVVVPLVDARGRLEMAEDRIVGGLLGGDDLQPADLRLIGRPHVASERACQELRA